MEEQKNTSFFRFEDLRVYNKSLDYYNWLMAQVVSADDFTKKALFTPFLDAASRISVNIAEGSSNHKAVFVDYLKFAKGNVRECVVYTSMADICGAFDENQSETSRTMLIEMTKMLGAMIVSLQKSPSNNKEDRHSNYTQTVNGENNVDTSVNDFTSDLNFNY